MILNNSNLEYLKSMIKEEEGEVRNDEGFHVVYPGPKTKKPHIGWGHLLGQEQSEAELNAMQLQESLDDDWWGFTIDDASAEELLDIDIQDAIESLHPTGRLDGWTEDELEELDPERYVALISMAFQMGGYGVRSKFPSFMKAVKSEDWQRASDEMMWSNGLIKQKRSQWWKDSPTRCEEMADKMLHGKKDAFVEASNDIRESDIKNVLRSALSVDILCELERRLKN